MLDQVTDILDRLRASALRRAAGEGLAAGAVVALGVAACAAGVLALAPDAAAHRALLLGLIALGLAAPALFARRRMSQRFADPRRVAAYLESKRPELRTDVQSALEFADAPDLPSDPVAADLRARLVERVNADIGALRGALPTLTPRRDLSAVRWAAFGVAACAAVLALASPTYRAGAHALAFGPPADDEAVQTAAQPVVGALTYEAVYPAYTRKPPRFVAGATHEIRTLVGAEIRFVAPVFLEAERAVLVVDNGEQSVRHQLDLDKGRLSGAVRVSGDATWRFELIVAGAAIEDPIERRVRAQADAAPQVDLMEPAEPQQITPQQIVDMRYVASDDFGLSEVSLIWRFAGSEDGERQVPLQGALGTNRFEEHVPFDLAPLGLQPRDEIVVYIEAVDNDAESGAKAGRSRPLALRVASPDDRHDEVLAALEEVFEALLRQLGGTLVVPVVAHAVADDTVTLSPAPLSAAQRASAFEALQPVQQAWAPVLELYAATVTAMEEDPLSIEADVGTVRATHEAVREAVQALGLALGGAPSPPSDADAVSVAMRTADVIAATERAVLLLQDVVATHRADDVQRAMAELSDVRDRLEDLIRQYRDTQDPELREQIERELRRLESRMRELLERIASQVEELPVEHLNADALEPSEISEQVGEMRNTMDNVRQMLDSGDVDAALSYLEQLEQELASMDDELQPLGDAQPDTLSEFDQRMGELMDEVNNLEAQESALESETQALLDEMLAEREREMEQQTASFVEQAMETLNGLVDELEGQDQDPLSSGAQQGIRNAREGLEQIARLLEEGDIAGAEAAAARQLSGVNDLEWELRRDSSMLMRDPEGRAMAERTSQSARRTSRELRDLRAGLDSLMRASQPRPNGAQRAQLDQLAQEQAQVQQRLGALQERAAEMGERFPMVGESLEPMFEQAGEQMGAVQRELRGGRPRPALRGEQSARESLRSMREQMQQLTQRQRQRQQRNGRQQSRDRVEVPDDGASDRARFRQRVVESMRDDGLDAYREEIQQYYETLLE